MAYKILGVDNQDMGSIESPTPEALKQFYDAIKAGYAGKLKNEFFEVLNADGAKSGTLKPRDLIHKDGDWHGAFHLHVYSQSDSGNYILFQKRRHDKDVCPDKIDTVAAGHYAIGETIEDGVREVEEEIGLRVRFQDLTSLGRRINYDPQYDKGIFNFEFQDVAAYRCDQPLTDYRLQEEELAGLIKVELKSFIDLMMGRKDELKDVEGLMFHGDQLQGEGVRITRDDIWPAPFDNYYLKTALIISNICEGRKVPAEPYKLDVTNFFV